MISLPQIQFACDVCNASIEVEVDGSCFPDVKDFYFDADEWMEENGWARMSHSGEVRCPACGFWSAPALGYGQEARDG